MVTTWFDATQQQQHALLDLVDEVKLSLDRELQPEGYNVGLNAGHAFRTRTDGARRTVRLSAR